MMNDDIYIGMRLEVLDEHNRLKFVGMVVDLDNDMIKITDIGTQDVPPMVHGTEIRLRGFAPGMRLLNGIGYISGTTADYWRLERLTFTQTVDMRSSYRHRLNADAEVMLANDIFGSENTESNRSTEKFPCRVLNVSMGGLQFSCREKFEVKDYVLVRGLQITPEIEDSMKFTFTCRILRVSEILVGYTYGCELVGLEAKEQEELTHTIFQAQRMELKKRRGTR